MVEEFNHYPMEMIPFSNKEPTRFRIGPVYGFKSSRRLRIYRKDAEKQNKEEYFEKAMKATLQAENSKLAQFDKLYMNLHMNCELVERNYVDLIDILKSHEGTSEMYRDTTPEWAVSFTRMLANYVSSNKNRENHTKNKALPYFDSLCENEPIVSKDYRAKVTDLGVDLVGYFFTSLRNTIVHDGIPQIVVTWENEPDAAKLGLDKQYLIQNKSMSTRAKAYIDDWDDVIDAKQIIEEYYNRVDELYRWLFSEIEDRFEDRFGESTHLFEEAKNRQVEFEEQCGISTTTLRWLTSNEVEDNNDIDDE
jgi:hypothetical protein